MNEKIRNFDLLKLLRRFGSFFYVFIFTPLILIAGILVISTFNIPGNYKLLVVESGSMNPTIMQGSVILIKPENNYLKNDIVTVSDPANPKVSITHRIVEIEKKDGNVSYVTKGDANEDPDTEKRLKENVAGKVLFSIPFIGYVIDFAKTKNGLLMLIIIPCMLIIYSEAMKVIKEVYVFIGKKNHV